MCIFSLITMTIKLILINGMFNHVRIHMYTVLTDYNTETFLRKSYKLLVLHFSVNKNQIVTSRRQYGRSE